eukprot:Gregarina_sp_Poly_1__6817@NODE_368_length_9159_cov_50_005939_g304_i0_p5_GENE_NODE_368_length_9159_cov_50_005939_g304_i0NODE_368_length_9159_cov_50_005939_g304_i0_p5_ORF_typecomplete_len112_score11_64_NODE_368_length_9159_cov_50_005939_g304_i053535688
MSLYCTRVCLYEFLQQWRSRRRSHYPSPLQFEGVTSDARPLSLTLQHKDVPRSFLLETSNNSLVDRILQTLEAVAHRSQNGKGFLLSGTEALWSSINDYISNSAHREVWLP